MIDRFQHAKEQQPDPHTGGKQHREPCRVGIFRHRFLAPQTYLGHGQKDQHDAKNDKEVHDNHEHPVELGGGEITHREEDRPRLIRKDHRQKHKNHRSNPRDHENGVMNVKANGAEGAVDIVLTDLEISLYLAVF